MVSFQHPISKPLPLNSGGGAVFRRGRGGVEITRTSHPYPPTNNILVADGVLGIPWLVLV